MTTIDEVLEHFGVKGQKWGVRRRSSGKTSGPDISKLSDQELRTMVSRMQLEKQFRDLSSSSNKKGINAGASFAKGVLKDVGKQQARGVIVKGGTAAVASIGTALLIAKRMVSG